MSFRGYTVLQTQVRSCSELPVPGISLVPQWRDVSAIQAVHFCCTCNGNPEIIKHTGNHGTRLVFRAIEDDDRAHSRDTFVSEMPHMREVTLNKKALHKPS